MNDDESVRNFIAGSPAAAASGRTTDLLDPSAGKPSGTAALSGPEDVDRAAKAARAGFERWRRTTPGERQLALHRIADALEARAEEFVRLEARHTGKPLHITSSEEMGPMIDQIRFFAGAARHLEGRAAGEYFPGHTSMLRREPVGVCAQVTPWNYPLMMAVWKFAPAVAAGNSVILKPADSTPATTAALAELASEFLPDGVFNVVCGDRDTGRSLVAHPGPDMVSITGSVRAGKEVAGTAAQDVKRVHLELGGKAPVIVSADADIDAAARGIAEAALFNAGQDCASACRVIVDSEVHDTFVEALTREAARTRTGPPDDPSAAYGPLNNPTQLSRVKGFLTRLPDHATITTGGSAVRGEGYFHEPTVVTGLRQDDEAVQEEIFGPVITVQPSRGDEEAVRWANDVRYGLASSVWTRAHDRAMRMAAEIDAGCVWINCHIPVAAEMPHGGFKQSGYGKDLSSYSLEDYTRIKHVMSHTGAMVA
ncbi:gamma-aminobutyraldehyde dehydrogenase [Streptomyces sp. TS71-3]|uniref:gamma-aminobutyraldehyde dehydrogenase n=1 Tax=Streptomyces sp. TS71-3 TaxID=2733862 RepID=UPI001B2117A2|nr:gamma-aminobutyraldehyde dehydrogenase [Streptomyces sp. TS71-3]GHJ41601.1 gamma-aminobutyraldehyde dehydrogenase [Streptomyces sp. TS71-3]